MNGAAAGGGFGFASAFHIRIASEQARFTTVFIKRALAPDCGLSWFLPRLVGAQRAAELFYSGRVVDAQEALKLGIVERVTTAFLDRYLKGRPRSLTRLGDVPGIATLSTR